MLTWFAARQCWKKKINGKVFYFKGTYEQALRAYHLHLEATDDSDIGRIPLGPKIEPRKVDDYETLKAEFLNFMESRVDAGERSENTLSSIVGHLNYFSRWFGNKRIHAIDDDCMEQFYQHLAKEPFGSTRKNNIQRGVLQFCRWVQKRKRNLKYSAPVLDAYGTYQRVIKSDNHYVVKPKDFEKLNQLDAQTKAKFLLGINCAFTSKDLADLKWSYIDFENGRLKYRRVKTKKRLGPLINYKLFPCTIEALAALPKNNELVFVSRNGLPLVHNIRRKSPTDSWVQAWRRLRKAKKVPNIQFKMLRKSGATIIEKKFPGAVLAYLADKPSGITAHYVIRDGEINPEFDKALMYLAKELGL